MAFWGPDGFDEARFRAAIQLAALVATGGGEPT